MKHAGRVQAELLKKAQEEKAKQEQACEAEQTAKAKVEPSDKPAVKPTSKAEPTAKPAGKAEAEQGAASKAEQIAADKAAGKKSKDEVITKLKVLKNTKELFEEFKKNQDAQLKAIADKAVIKAEENVLDTLFSMYSALKIAQNSKITEPQILAGLSAAISSSSKNALTVMKSTMKLILKEVPDAKTVFGTTLKEVGPTISSIRNEAAASGNLNFEAFANKKVDQMANFDIVNFIIDDVITQQHLQAYTLRTFINLASDALLINKLKLKQVVTTSDKQKVTTYVDSKVEDAIGAFSKTCMAKFSTTQQAKSKIDTNLESNINTLKNKTEKFGCTDSDWCKFKKSTWKEVSNMEEFARKGTNKILDTICKLNLPNKPVICATKPADGEYCKDVNTCINFKEFDSLVNSISNSPTDSYINE